MARRPPEREEVYLDGGRRTTQLMRDSLGGGIYLRRLSTTIAFTVSLASRALAQDSLRPPRVWVAGETDQPTFCLILDSTGTARFAAGFLWLNPLKWRYDSASTRLSLTFSRLHSNDVRAFAESMRRGLGPLLFDSSTKTVTYDLGADADIWIFNYRLGSPTELDSSNYAIAARRCKLPRRP